MQYLRYLYIRCIRHRDFERYLFLHLYRRGNNKMSIADTWANAFLKRISSVDKIL